MLSHIPSWLHSRSNFTAKRLCSSYPVVPSCFTLHRKATYIEPINLLLFSNEWRRWCAHYESGAEINVRFQSAQMFMPKQFMQMTNSQAKSIWQVGCHEIKVSHYENFQQVLGGGNVICFKPRLIITLKLRVNFLPNDLMRRINPDMKLANYGCGCSYKKLAENQLWIWTYGKSFLFLLPSYMSLSLKQP